MVSRKTKNNRVNWKDMSSYKKLDKKKQAQVRSQHSRWIKRADEW